MYQLTDAGVRKMDSDTGAAKTIEGNQQMKMINLTITASVLAISSSASANSLQPRLGGLAFYDDVADLTWLADANYAQTSGYAAANANNLGFNINTIKATGVMGWQAANDWAAQLTVAGVSGWRLANTLDVGNDGATYTRLYQGVDYGYNITAASELSNMYYNVLGNMAAYDTSGGINTCVGNSVYYCQSNTGPFSNLSPYAYWSATEYAPDISSRAWNFGMNLGGQGDSNKTVSKFAWAVQSGDVSPVPVPAAVWLFGSGLIGLIGLARRKH